VWAIDIGNNVNYTINQGAAHKRTFGVVGVWHVDVGNTGAGAGKGVGWTPLNGSTRSLWCGLRRHGDVTVSDPITGNAFNAALLMHSGVNGGSATGGTGTSRSSRATAPSGIRWPTGTSTSRALRRCR